MKTSNKIILGLFLLSLASSLTAMVVVKKNMIIEKNETIEGNGKQVSKVLSDSLNYSSFDFNKSYRVSLDPNSKSVILKWDENLIDVVEIGRSDEVFELFYKENTNISFDSKPELIVGVKGIEDLSVRVRHDAHLNTTGQLGLKSLNVHTEDHAKLDLDVNSQIVMYYSENSAKNKLSGKSQVMILESEDDTESDFRALDLSVLTVKMHDDTEAKIGECELAAGQVRRHSVLSFTGDLPDGHIRERNDAQILINQK